MKKQSPVATWCSYKGFNFSLYKFSKLLEIITFLLNLNIFLNKNWIYSNRFWCDFSYTIIRINKFYKRILKIYLWTNVEENWWIFTEGWWLYIRAYHTHRPSWNLFGHHFFIGKSSFKTIFINGIFSKNEFGWSNFELKFLKILEKIQKSLFQFFL